MASWPKYGQAAKTAAGCFWKAGCAFVLGYAICAMIQTFIPKGRLIRHMGDSNAHSISLVTFGCPPESACAVEDVPQFKIAYTFWLNIFFAVLTHLLIRAAQVCPQCEPTEIDASGFRQIVALVFDAMLLVGGIAYFVTGGA